ncbi:Zn-ribbon domain-containing OB-fold protein [Streptomyces ipomoeae]|uniref:Zn-ribbon domain-containing OB-fold protein n=1 Tax=Streptomyces ipomoeae TaxID=103232 RepID=UPI001147159A|nr:Zn-ribbon domain-containing OB-fold protein [Streptomyces ipomoeae]MDX2937778.1 Zn-ribbon domain-containing OB-fold protein [Streptomyces ipomoeae]TQE17217.1 Zn-ribbon domain-containing OB-fold protein [Streptomyces ipomoeae]
MSDTRTADPIPLTRPFWEAAANGVLVRPVCSDCGRDFFVPQLCCPHCRSERWEYVASAGTGRVETYSVVHRAPSPQIPTPYVVAVIRLDEGWTMMSNIVGPTAEQVAIGSRVAVTFQDKAGFGIVPAFEPEGNTVV